MPTIEELQGVAAGLISVVKDLTANVSQVTQTVGNMAEAAPAAPHHDHNQGLCMPSMQLPSFRQDSVVQDDISEFLERFTQQTLHLHVEKRLSFLEQRFCDWPRSMLSIAKTTEGYAEKAAEEFGESKEDKCCRLAVE